MAIKIKDAADLFAAERERATEIIDGLKAGARDALEVMLSEAPKGSNRERYQYVRENVFPHLRE